MKHGIEYRRDGQSRVIKYTGNYITQYRVEHYLDGVWVASANGPFDYLRNARTDADGGQHFRWKILG